LFAGFAPPKAAARITFLEEFVATPATLIFYETGPRLSESLADMATVFGPRPATVAREITKLFEEFRRERLDVLAAHYAQTDVPRGEMVVLVGPPPPDAAASDAALDALLVRLLSHHSVKEAAALAAEQLNAPRKRAYARALALKAEA
jgi:16S rRNA (cytidine1402-2'-O)-methyltransferase